MDTKRLHGQVIEYRLEDYVRFKVRISYHGKEYSKSFEDKKEADAWLVKTNQDKEIPLKKIPMNKLQKVKRTKELKELKQLKNKAPKKLKKQKILKKTALKSLKEKVMENVI